MFKNNIEDAGSRCLISVNKTSVPANTHPVDVDYNLYYCASGSKASEWKEYPATVKGFEKYVQLTDLTGIPIFQTRVSLILPGRIFTCGQIPPRLRRAQMPDCRWEKSLTGGSPRVKSGIDIGCYQKR